MDARSILVRCKARKELIGGRVSKCELIVLRHGINYYGRCLIFTIFVSVLSTSYCLRMVNLDLPENAMVGESVDLTCLYSLDSSSDLISPRTNSYDEFIKKNGQVGQLAMLDKQNHINNNNMSHLEGYKMSSVIGVDDKFRNKMVEDDYRAESGTKRQDSVQSTLPATTSTENLYAVKWYKDDKEFYRYLAHEFPRKLALPVDGITVDLDQSNNHTVRLRGVSLKTSGLFRCEVSLDAPHFLTEGMQRKMRIFLLPNSVPVIEFTYNSSKPLNCRINPTTRCHSLGSSIAPTKLHIFALGDQVVLTCTPPESKPTAQLDWVINGWLNLSTTMSKDFNEMSLVRDKNQREPGANQIIVPRDDYESLGAANRISIDQTTKSFSVSRQTFVKLPSLKNNNDIVESMSSSINDNLYELINEWGDEETSSSATKRFKLIGHQEPTDQSIITSQFNYPKTIAGLSLDQLPEISTSRLSFSVDEDIFQSLYDISKPAYAKQSHLPIKRRKTRHNSLRNSKEKQISNKNQVSQNRTSGWQVQSASLPPGSFNADIMHISCVARVLHLRLRSDIKIMKSSVTFSSKPRSSSPASSVTSPMLIIMAMISPHILMFWVSNNLY